MTKTMAEHLTYGHLKQNRRLNSSQESQWRF